MGGLPNKQFQHTAIMDNQSQGGGALRASNDSGDIYMHISGLSAPNPQENKES